MPAFVSLAFALPGAVKAAVSEVRNVINGLNHVVSLDDECGELSGMLALGSASVPMWLRAYDRGGWVALTLDVDEDTYEHLAAEIGRTVAVDSLVVYATQLVIRLATPYVFIEEEAEADVDPRGVRGDIALFGITVLRSDLVGLEHALNREDVIRVSRGIGWVVVWRRLDPVPHYV